MANNASNITYPYAEMKDGSLVAPKQANHSDNLICLGCKQPMIVRKGQARIWHFAHCPGQDLSCSGEGALNKATKLAIKEGFDSARGAGDAFPLQWHCRECRSVRSYNTVQLAEHVELEASLSSQVRVDVLFSSGTGKPQFAIEVVVTHSPEPETATAKLGLSIFIVEPTWDSIEEFKKGIQATETMTVSNFYESAREREAGVRLLLDKVEPIVERMKQEEGARHIVDKALTRQSQEHFTYWGTDRKGREMYERTKRSVHANAKGLGMAGFKQENKQEPWLFTLHLQVQAMRVKVYADLGGTDQVPIYENTSPILYVFPRDELPENIEEAILERAIERLQTHGVEASITR